MRTTVKIGVAAERAIEVLEIVAQAGRTVSGKEITDRLSLPKPTVYRVCTALEAMGLVHRDPVSKRFSVGRRLCALGLDALSNSPSRGPIHAVLQSLATQLKETCTFTILDGNEALCIDRVESDTALRLHLQAGSRIPLHCTASGKLFLAMIPRTLALKLLHSAPLKRYTPNTIVDPVLLEKQLPDIRRERLSWDNEGYCLDLVALAVPVLGKSGRIRGTLSVNAPANRLSLEAARKHASTLRLAATAIAESLLEDLDEESCPTSV